MAGMADDVSGHGGGAVASVTDLFRDHHLELVRLALLMVGDRATAEDVVQDAFEGLHRGWHGLHQPSSGLAYVPSSVLNGCRSVHRRGGSRAALLPGPGRG
jgi:DNA-directed RNA polymerase specialized sigma24 family protein